MKNTQPALVKAYCYIKARSLHLYRNIFNTPKITYKTNNAIVYKSKLKAIYEANRKANEDGTKWHVAIIPPGKYIAIPETLYKYSGLESVYTTE